MPERGLTRTSIHEQHRPSTPRATPFNTLLALGICFVVIFIFFSVVARFRVLYKDDWDLITPLLRQIRLRDYVLLTGNEHILVIPRLLWWLDYRLSGLQGALTWTVGLGCYLLTALVVVEHQWRRAELPPLMARAAIGVTLVLLFFNYELQVFLSPAGVTIPIAVVLAIGAMLTMIRACRSQQRGPYAWWLAVTAGFVLASILSSGQGLAVPFALAAIVVASSAKPVTPILAGILICTTAAVWLFARATGVHAPSPDVHTIGRMTLFGLAFLAGPISYGSVAAGVIVGAAILAAAFREGFAFVRRERPLSDCQLLCTGIIVFVLVTAAMTAMARAYFGIAQAAQSRYALLATMNLSAVFVLWTIRMSESPAGHRRFHNASSVALVLIAGALPIDLFVGAVWWAKAENVRAAALALRVGAPDFEWIGTLHPDPSRPYEWSRALRVFSAVTVQDSPEVVMPRCEGDIQLQPREGGRFFRMSGRRLAASSGATVVLQDNIGAVQGLAGIAPLVNVSSPTYGQVISAVWHAVRRGRFHEPEWFGFALPGAGPPYRALTIEKGRAICSVPVS